MVRRFIAHFCLILLFAFTQAEVVTHEISHLTDFSGYEHNQPSQQDKKTAHPQCEKCLSLSHAAAFGLSNYFVFNVSPAISSYISKPTQGFITLALFSYQARAPPSSLIA